MKLQLKNVFIIVFIPNTALTEKGNVNEEFDRSLEFVRNIIKDEEPIMSGPMRDDIDYCNITGAYTIYRSGDITAVKMNESISRIYLNLGWKKLNLACVVHNKVLSVKIATAIVTSEIENIQIYVDAIVNYDDDHHTRIQTAKVTNPGKFSLNYKGQGFLGKTLGFFVNLLKPLVTKQVQYLVLETVEILIHKSKKHLGYIANDDD